LLLFGVTADPANQTLNWTTPVPTLPSPPPQKSRNLSPPSGVAEHRKMTRLRSPWYGQPASSCATAAVAAAAAVATVAVSAASGCGGASCGACVALALGRQLNTPCLATVPPACCASLLR